MKSLLGFGMLFFALSFCGLGERLQSLQGDGNTPGGTTPATADKSSDGDVDTASLNSDQKAIADAATEVKWEEQNMSWRLPEGWNKMDVRKESFNYGSPAVGFLIGTISTMPASFPAEISLKAQYDSALEQLKQGKYETVRWLEIDGIKGVEWVEAMPEDKTGPRRHQWIAFRNYQGQNQQLNIMVSTKGNEFDQKRDTFAAIMYSMKISKG
ncbi:MAG: hypothetical protein IPM21_01555 [Acidobacteria bacterium]|nr:hypothetical protein [Acidobacteriota bacterium]